MIMLMVFCTEIYCWVGFEAYLLDTPLEDLNLPEVVAADLESNRRVKTTELEVSSIYIYGIIIIANT